MPSSIQEANKPKLAAYAPPSLKAYGSVLALTASGVSGVQENGNQPNCSTASTRRPC